MANRKYWKTLSGKLMMTYNNMSKRVRGYTKAHLYEGLEILDRQTFYTWSKLNPAFNSLHGDWELSGYERRLSPSIDRIDSSMGYTIDNIRWITLSENSRLGAISKWSK